MYNEGRVPGTTVEPQTSLAPYPYLSGRQICVGCLGISYQLLIDIPVSILSDVLLLPWDAYARAKSVGREKEPQQKYNDETE